MIEPVKEPVPTLLEAVLVRPAEDLPDVWGVGEEVQVACTLSDDEAQGVRGAGVTVTIGESGEPVHLVTGDDGRCSTSTVAESSGTYPAAVEFPGDDESYLASSAHLEYRVVDFREEVVRLYNLFLEWAGRTVTGVSEETTPREVELMVVGQGVRVDERALEEIIRRFEEADYSEHEITRREYEAMYRAWRRVAAPEPER